MKFKTLILLGASTLAVGATSLAIVSKLPELNSGVGADSTVTLYVQVGSYWNTGSYAIWHWASGSGTWSSLMTSVTGVTGLYSTSISTTDANVIFTEFNSGTTTPDWGSKKYQTGNLTYGTNNLYTLTSTTAGTWSTYTPAVSYSITEYAVVDGVAEATAYTTETAYSNANFTPSNVTRAGYTHGGWFTDAACTTAYVAKTWTAAGTLYAKYTTIVYDSYVYFSAPSWTSCYAYTFKNGNAGQLGAWPGTKVTSVTDGVNYQGSGIYRVGYNSTVGDTGIVFNKGTGGTKGTDQTYDLTLTAGMFYKLADQSTGDADKGAGAKVVYDINIARRAVSASSGILASSLCGISKAKATALVAEYDALNATAQGYVNVATDYTYNYTDNTGNTKVDVTVNYMVAQLRVIAAGSGSAYYVDNLNTSNILVYSILGVVGALSVGGFFFFQKKRREEIR